MRRLTSIHGISGIRLPVRCLRRLASGGTQLPQQARVAVWLLLAVLPVALGAVLIMGTPRESSPEGPSILLITVDALRADAVGYASEDAPPTPAIDGLAHRGVVFSTAFAQAPWTLPSFASMMTSRYPSEAGVALARDEKGHANTGDWRSLNSAVPTLAEVLHNHGYTTAARISNVHLSEEYGLQRGFSDVTYYSDNGDPFSTLVDAEHITKEAISWLERHGEDQFLLWVHYMDVHAPYGAPGSGAPVGEDWKDLEALPRDKAAAPATKLEVRERLGELYRSGVTYCDSWVGELIQSLSDVGVAERTVVVLTADHGEEFWEHEFWGRPWRGHGRTLNDEVLRVPLVIMFPDGRQAGRTIKQPVRLLDLMPTVLEIAGVECPGDARGGSLIPLMDAGGQGGVGPRELFAESLRHGDEIKGIRSRDCLLTYRPKDGKLREYQKKELWPETGSFPDLGRAELQDRLRQWSDDMEAALKMSGGEAPSLSLEQKRELEALGYL